jgi:hypothetical protein
MAQMELAMRRRLEVENSGERLLLEAAGLSDPVPSRAASARARVADE